MSSYKEISEDVICRWCYPLVPDNEIGGIYVCSYNRNDVYYHPTVKLSYSTQLVKRCCRLIERGVMDSGGLPERGGGGCGVEELHCRSPLCDPEGV